MTRVVAVIPARYASQRFPGKALAAIDGLPMIVRVLRNVMGAASIDDVLVATDDDRIAAVVEQAGGEAVLTDPDLPSGTDRVWAAVRDMDVDATAVVNVQGDEPLLDSASIDAVVNRLLADDRFDITTPVVAVSRRDAWSSDVVTVARDEDGAALYFSRARIPHGTDRRWRHIGLYAYRRHALERFVGRGRTDLERAESLEQLRALTLGLRIGAVEVTGVFHAVDRPADVGAVERIMAGGDHGPLPPVDLVVLDVDGVLTDGRITYAGPDRQVMAFDVKDGYGLTRMMRAGVRVALLSARDGVELRRRAAELGITEVIGGASDKSAALVDLCRRLEVDLGRVCYVGDDDPDVGAMRTAGISAAPGDASDLALATATIRLSARGGRGAVRELADLFVVDRHI